MPYVLSDDVITANRKRNFRVVAGGDGLIEVIWPVDKYEESERRKKRCFVLFLFMSFFVS